MAATGQTGPKLTAEQRDTLLGWLAADYSEKLIRKWFVEREWPLISPQAFWHLRQRFMPEIEAKRAERHAAALNTGLALKEERVARLAHHADELDEIKWLPDEKGRLWNEKAWRETLDDIAREMGHRKAAIEHSGPGGGPLTFRQIVVEMPPDEREDTAPVED
jgi:hypothetical protein